MTTSPRSAPDPPQATPRSRLDEMIARLRDGAETFAELGLDERITLARAMQSGYLRVAERSVRAACAAKGSWRGSDAGLM